MPTKLTDYLIRLSFEPQELARFFEDPATAVLAVGLSPPQQEALVSRDPDRITEAIIAENAGQKKMRSAPQRKDKSGSLTVVGVGIQIGQTTLAARAVLEHADKVLFMANDLLSFLWLRQLNSTAESLHVLFQRGQPRFLACFEITDRILACVRQGLRVCLAAYGHPGILQISSHEAMERARLEGYPARMLPAPSAEDCLFADLGINPGKTGWQSFAATDFLIHGRAFDTSCSLILWQIGFIGNQAERTQHDSRRLQVLSDFLQKHYGAGHEAMVYEAAFYPVCDPVKLPIPLGKLAEAPVTARSTLFVPPAKQKPGDLQMIGRLTMDPIRGLAGRPTEGKSP